MFPWPLNCKTLSLAIKSEIGRVLWLLQAQRHLIKTLIENATSLTTTTLSFQRQHHQTDQ